MSTVAIKIFSCSCIYSKDNNYENKQKYIKLNQNNIKIRIIHNFEINLKIQFNFFSTFFLKNIFNWCGFQYTHLWFQFNFQLIQSYQLDLEFANQEFTQHSIFQFLISVSLRLLIAYQFLEKVFLQIQTIQTLKSNILLVFRLDQPSRYYAQFISNDQENFLKNTKVFPFALKSIPVFDPEKEHVLEQVKITKFPNSKYLLCDYDFFLRSSKVPYITQFHIVFFSVQHLTRIQNHTILHLIVHQAKYFLAISNHYYFYISMHNVIFMKIIYCFTHRSEYITDHLSFFKLVLTHILKQSSIRSILKHYISGGLLLIIEIINHFDYVWMFECKVNTCFTLCHFSQNSFDSNCLSSTEAFCQHNSTIGSKSKITSNSIGSNNLIMLGYLSLFLHSLDQQLKKIFWMLRQIIGFSVQFVRFYRIII